MNHENIITLNNNVQIYINLVLLFRLSVRLPVDDQVCLDMVRIFRQAGWFEWLGWNCLLGCLLCSFCLLVKLFRSVCLSGYLRKAWWRVCNRVCIWSWGIRLILLWPLILFRFCFLGWLLYQSKLGLLLLWTRLNLFFWFGCVSSELWCISLECSKLSLLLVAEWWAWQSQRGKYQYACGDQQWRILKMKRILM